MSTPELPARISLGFRQDNRLSFTGLEENRSLPFGGATAAIRELLEDIYFDAIACEDSTHISKRCLGNHFQIRWTTQGGSKLRFYLASIKKDRPKFEVPSDDRVIRLRGMIEDAYDVAMTDAQLAEGEAAKPDGGEAQATDEQEKPKVEIECTFCGKT